MPFGKDVLFGEHDINIEIFYNVMSKKLVSIKNEDAFKTLENIKENMGNLYILTHRMQTQWQYITRV